MHQAVLHAERLRKAYGTKLAVDDITFHVRAGEIVGLLGPNGAGKTTTISMILGVLEPTAGHVHIGGLDVVKNRSKALEKTNFAAVYAPLPGNLTVRQNLKIFGLIYGVKALKSKINAVIEEFNLQHLRDTKCGLLSSGEQTRVALAKAMLCCPGSFDTNPVPN